MNNEEMMDALRFRVETLKSQGKLILEDENLRKNVDEIKQKTSHIIRKHPVLTLAGGFLVGVVMGVLISGDE